MPKSTNSAAVTGLPSNISRRAILSAAPSVAAAAAIGVGALTLPAIAGPSDEVSRLLDLERRLFANQKDVDAAWVVHDQIARELNRDKRRCCLPRNYFENDPNGVRSQYDFSRRSARFDARVARLKEESGFNAATDHLQRLKELRDDLHTEVWGIKATCMESFKCKARMASITTYVAGSLASDLREL